MFFLLFKVADITVQQNNCPGDCFDNFGFNIGRFKNILINLINKKTERIKKDGIKKNISQLKCVSF